MYCPYCQTELETFTHDTDYYWCHECNDWWYMTTLEPGRIPGKIRYQIVATDRQRLASWNAKVQAWNDRRT